LQFIQFYLLGLEEVCKCRWVTFSYWRWQLVSTVTTN